MEKKHQILNEGSHHHIKVLKLEKINFPLVDLQSLEVNEENYNVVERIITNLSKILRLKFRSFLDLNKILRNTLLPFMVIIYI